MVACFPEADFHYTAIFWICTTYRFPLNLMLWVSLSTSVPKIETRRSAPSRLDIHTWQHMLLPPLVSQRAHERIQFFVNRCTTVLPYSFVVVGIYFACKLEETLNFVCGAGPWICQEPAEILPTTCSNTQYENNFQQHDPSHTRNTPPHDWWTAVAAPIVAHIFGHCFRVPQCMGSPWRHLLNSGATWILYNPPNPLDSRTCG